MDQQRVEDQIGAGRHTGKALGGSGDIGRVTRLAPVDTQLPGAQPGRFLGGSYESWQALWIGGQIQVAAPVHLENITAF